MIPNIKEEYKKIREYHKPMMIILSGHPGSGITTLANYLSSELRILNYSTDNLRSMLKYIYCGGSIDALDNEDAKELYRYISKKYRSYNIDNIDIIANMETYKDVSKLILSRKSFVLDAHTNFLGQYKLAKAINPFYNVIRIYVKSDDIENNIARIQEHTMDYKIVDRNIIGHKINCSINLGRQDIYDKSLKIYPNIPFDRFDYIIENENSLGEFMASSKEVKNKILSMYH